MRLGVMFFPPRVVAGDFCIQVETELGKKARLSSISSREPEKTKTFLNYQNLNKYLNPNRQKHWDLITKSTKTLEITGVYLVRVQVLMLRKVN